MVCKLKSYRKYTAHRLGSNILEKCKKKLAFMIWLNPNYGKGYIGFKTTHIFQCHIFKHIMWPPICFNYYLIIHNYKFLLSLLVKVIWTPIYLYHNQNNTVFIFLIQKRYNFWDWPCSFIILQWEPSP